MAVIFILQSWKLSLQRKGKRFVPSHRRDAEPREHAVASASKSKPGPSLHCRDLLRALSAAQLNVENTFWILVFALNHLPSWGNLESLIASDEAWASSESAVTFSLLFFNSVETYSQMFMKALILSVQLSDDYILTRTCDPTPAQHLEHSSFQ